MTVNNWIELCVNDHSSPRLDRYLALLFSMSRDKIKQLIQAGDVLVNQEVSKPSYQLSIKDHLSICFRFETKVVDQVTILEVANNYIKTDRFLIPIIFQDDDLMIINKPPGLLVHEAVSSVSDNLVRILIAAQITLFESHSQRPGIVHRLDQFTEGLLIIVKSALAYQSLKDQFKQRSIQKKYFAVLKGVPSHMAGEINMPIGRDMGIRARQSCHSIVPGSEKDALTRYEVIDHTTNLAVVDVELITGRTHQIRVHFAALQCPVLGDSLYSKQVQKSEGYYLQSYYLKFTHPRSSEVLEFQLPMSSRLNKYTQKR